MSRWIWFGCSGRQLGRLKRRIETSGANCEERRLASCSISRRARGARAGLGASGIGRRLGRFGKWRRLCRSRWLLRTSVRFQPRWRLARRGWARGFGSLRSGQWRGRRGWPRRPCGLCSARGAFGGGRGDLRISCEVVDVAGLFLARSGEREAVGLCGLFRMACAKNRRANVSPSFAPRSRMRSDTGGRRLELAPSGATRARAAVVRPSVGIYN